MVDVAQRLANLSPAQRQLLEKRLQQKPNVSQPIAVVGMSCRFPGAPDPESYWQLIEEQRTAVTEIPPERWDVERYYDKDPDTPGKASVRWGAFVDNAKEFDARFFGITPREVIKMDPQQRLMLECTWEAFEDAGLAVDDVSGSSTGVFVGIGATDYSKLPNQFDNYLEYIDPYMGTGNALSLAANRVSYIMDLRGPSVAVDTACSSALVATHLAVQSLRSGECDSAVVGGVSMVLTPEVLIAFSKARMLSQTGECRPFDASANGYVRGEGCGVVLLKRLTDAARDGDNVIAVIRGSAINQDGRTSGITAPNSLSQVDCIRSSWSNAGIEPSQISYIEAHGTGTPLGDPIEFQSLTKLFPKRPDSDQPVHVSSVKANIGHTETCSGIAGLIKVLLMMKNGTIPGQTGFEELNPNINLAGTRLQIPTKSLDWKSKTKEGKEGNLVAGVSSFGFGGTNSHVILESSSGTPAARKKSAPAATERSQHVLTFSAKSEQSLSEVARRLSERLESVDECEIADFCYSSNTGRAKFNHRAAIIANDKATFAGALSAVAEGKRNPKAKSGEVRIATKPKVAFMFSGQGSQYKEMGRKLYEAHPVFRRELDRCAEILKEYRDKPLLDVIFADDALNETAYTQPALFALEYALARLWRSWGIEPGILIGHSVGEYVAACVAGVFSLEDGLKLIAKRAELMQQLPQNGTMAVIFAPRDTVEEALKSYGEEIAVATANGPENNVISGKTELVEEVVAAFEKQGVGTQRLKVSHAFHSPLMDPMLDEFERYAATIEFARPTIPIVANRTGTIIETAEFDAAYWRDHIRNCVEFANSMDAIQEAGVHAFVEIGPSASLLGMGRRCIPDSEAAWLPSLRKGRDDFATLLTSAAEIFVLGFRVNWKAFDEPWTRQRVDLPHYPFDRQSYWVVDTDKNQIRSGGRGPSLHPMLGSKFPTAFESHLYEGRFSGDNPKFLKDHQVQGSIVVPAAGYIEQGLAIANLQFGEGQHGLENVAIQAAMFLPMEGFRLVQTTAAPEMGGRSTFDTYSVSGDTQEADPKWQLHVTGSMVHQESMAGTPAPDAVDLDAVKARVTGSTTRDEFYEFMAARNLVYGDSFQVLGDVFRTDTESLAEIQLNDDVKERLSEFHVHPCLGDALMQCVAGTVPPQADGSLSPYTYVPMQVKRVRKLAPLTEKMFAYAVRVSEESHPSPETVVSSVYLTDEKGNVLVEFDSVTVQRVGKAIGGAEVQDPADWLFHVDWQPQSQPAEQGDGEEIQSPELRLDGQVLLFADKFGASDAIAEQVTAAGGTPVTVRPGGKFAAVDGGFTVQPTEAEDYASLLAAAAENGPVSAAVHCWSFDCNDPTADSAGNAEGLAQSRDLILTSSLRLTQQAARITDRQPPQLWLVTGNAVAVAKTDDVVASRATLWGFGRVAAMEHPETGCRLVDLDPTASLADQAVRLVHDIVTKPAENQIAYRMVDGKPTRFVARLAESAVAAGDAVEGDGMFVPGSSPFRLRITAPGSFDALKYEPFDRPEPAKGQIEVAIRATGLNFSDVLKALGLYPGITDVIVPMGIEAAGVVTSLGEGVTDFAVGDEVMGVVPYSFASHAVTADYAMVKKPSNIDFEEASTIPITFLTAYYGMCRLAQLQKGERILIHAGAGGVGLAAIQIAKHIGAEIFATAGSDEKRDFLKSLGVHHVMNSRTLEFADQIREITNREGVDVVLNSLPGDAITESLGVLRAYGRFLEIGKTDIYSNSMIGLLPFQDNLSYFAIDLDRMLRQRPEYIRGLYEEMMKHFADGTYEALPFTRFTSSQTIDAYRYMAQRKNIGKVVVATDVPVESASGGEEAPTKFSVAKDGTYLITGGLGALGLQVADWLAERGAGQIALMSRRAPSDEVQKTMKSVEEHGSKVIAVQGDVMDLASLKTAIGGLEGPPLKGVIHAAGVLDDGVIFDMELEQFNKPLGPKVNGTWNLHAATLDQPLEMFVMFSSIACLLGSPGQCNYAAGNAYLDALAQQRRAAGLPATSINWGPWASSGMAADANLEEQMASRGMGMLPSQQALDLMGELIGGANSNTAVMSVQWANMLRSAMGASGKVPPLLKDMAEGVDLSGGSDSQEDRAFRESLGSMEVPARIEKMTEYLAGELANIMGMEPSDIDIVQPLGSMGLDSLMAIELKNKIESKLDMALPMAVFMHEPSVSSLATYAGENFGKAAE